MKPDAPTANDIWTHWVYRRQSENFSMWANGAKVYNETTFDGEHDPLGPRPGIFTSHLVHADFPGNRQVVGVGVEFAWYLIIAGATWTDQQIRDAYNGTRVIPTGADTYINLEMKEDLMDHEFTE